LAEAVVTVSRELAGLGVYVAYLVVPSVQVIEPTPRSVDELLARAEEEVRRRYPSSDALTRDPVVQAYRRLLWRLGVDPTKVRPSSEALARRVVRGRRLPRINSVVDIGNAVSLETLVPIGIYDLDRLAPPLTLERARGGELFEPIGGEPQRLQEGVPVLLDSSGAVVHVYPHRDSARTMVTREARRLLIIGAGAPGVERARVARAVRSVAELLAKLSYASLDALEPRLTP